MDKKIGLYICTGCGLEEALDINALTAVGNEEKVAVCKTCQQLCSKEGKELIKQDIENGEVNAVAIAGCSFRVNYDVFDFGPEILVERINLREHVVWTHTPNNEDTQMMAEDYIRMGMAKLKRMELPEPYVPEEEVVKTIMVVGGGLTGMTAALESAKAGYKTVLVEKENKLGGWAANLYKMAPVTEPFTEIADNYIPDIIKEIEANSNITVYTSSKVITTEGAPGMFYVTINQGSKEISEKVGSIVQATGAKPYEPENLGHLGYGKSDKVITQAMFEEMAKNGKLSGVEKIAFIQCAGSRDENHLPYCSAACCVESLKQSLAFKGINPKGIVYIFYRDIRSAGQYEHFYEKAQESGVNFIKYAEIDDVAENSGKMVITLDDVILGEKVEASDFDLVVLANGMVSTASFGEEMVEESEEDEKQDSESQESIANKPPVIQADILNLQYRQGPEIPILKHGFPDSNYICFPYETRRTGIYTAGSVRAPMDLLETREDATGAALKAVQCVENVSVGMALHPRSGDLSFPEFNMNRCTQCKRCTEECPFGAINEDEKANPLPNPTRCRRCGVCMGACPERIISFKNYNVPMVGNMIKNIEIPEEDEEKPRILIFACENDAIPALDMAGINKYSYNAWVRIIPVRCLGSLNLIWINDAMSKGFDGVLLMGCKHGEDYQCHFMKGSELAEYRLSKVSETLDRLGLESERVKATQVTIMDYDKIPQMIEDFTEEIDELGPNPMKDFQ
ncbi:MAG: hydrogenase iron-sulfur subunit [Clostridiales bacterium]|nr:hydrogenase iron-sulfur subunit [Clostridiales bacterium]MCF8021382.1 hydrogenase iron-sulfur subunit [Clostridiales bacterium]